MSFILGNDGVVEVNAEAIAEITQFSYNENAEQKDGTAMGDPYRKSKAGRPTVTGNITCNYDSTDTLGQEAIVIGEDVALLLYPEGVGSGLPQFSFTAQISEIGIEQPDDDKVTRTFAYALSSGTVDKTPQT